MKTKSIKGFTSLIALLLVLFGFGALLLANNDTTAYSPSKSVCWDVIANGSFEDDTGWITPVTEYQAAYSLDQAFIGQRSMRTGILDPQQNRYSYSSALQKVTLPQDATGAVLRFWLFPVSNEPEHLPLPENPLSINKEDAENSGDAQLVLILDQFGLEKERLVMMRRNDQTWLSFSFDVSHYAGQTIQVYFDTYNNGWGGVTSMFVDNVSLGNCPEDLPTSTPTGTPTETPTSTNTPTPTTTPTNTPTATNTPTVTPSPTPTSTPENQLYLPVILNDHDFCSQQLLLNGSFEENSAWYTPITEYPAAYSTAQAQDGARSMRTGIFDAADNRFSYSSTRQEVTIPGDTVAAPLTFWLYQASSEPAELSLPKSALSMKEEIAGSSGDAQLVLILDQNGMEIERLLMERQNQQTWNYYSFDLSHYAGQTIQVYFGVYNNGWSGITGMFVDNVSLTTCDTNGELTWAGN